MIRSVPVFALSLLLLCGIGPRLAAQTPPPASETAPVSPSPAPDAPPQSAAPPQNSADTPAPNGSSTPIPNPDAPPAANTTAPPVPTLPGSQDYVLRPGDIIAITMAGDQSVSTPDNGLVIPQDGRISFYIAKGVQAAGRTRAELEEALTEKVKFWVKNPTITVNLISTPYNYISVSGAVEKPGNIVFRQGMTVSEAFSLAGGPRSSADKVAFVQRPDAQGNPRFFSVDLIKLYGGDASQDIRVYPGDKIMVNDAWVYVNGQVKTPGNLTLRLADTVGKAIAAAGGTNLSADLQNAFIRRGAQSIPVDLRQVVEGSGNGAEVTFPLQAGDVLFVPALQSKVIVIGSNGNTGPIVLNPKVNDKALDVLAQTGVATGTSDLNRVLLIRNLNGNNEVRTQLNLGPNGPQSDNVILQNGDVLYVPPKRVKDRNATLLNATILTQLLGVTRTF